MSLSVMWLVLALVLLTLLLPTVQCGQSPLSAAAAATSATRRYHSAASRGSQTVAADSTAPSHSIHRGVQRGLSTGAADETSAASSAADSHSHVRHLLQVSETDPLVIPLATGNQSAGGGKEYLSAVSFVFTHLSATTSSFILFPYSFTLNDSGRDYYPQGAFISTTQLQSVDSALPKSSAATNFNYAVSVASQLVSSTAGPSQAQAVYDSSIAIFIAYGLLPGDPTGSIRLLTNEAPNVCQSLYGSILGKWAQCWDATAWQSYLHTARYPESASIVYVQAADIASGILFNNGLPRFGSLIFSDIYLGSADAILANVSQTAVQAVRAFVTAGGTIISSGKGAVIVQSLGLVTAKADGSSMSTVFANDTELVALSGYTTVATKGCELQSFSSTQLTELNFAARTLCFSLGTGQAGSITTALVSSPPVDLTALPQSSLSTIATYNTATSPLLIRTADGLSTAVPSSATNTPMLLYGQLGEGQIVLHLGNAPISAASYPWIYNMLFLSNTRPVLLQTSFPSNVPDIIPALEQVSVDVNLNVANLYFDTLQHVRLLVWPANGVAVLDSPVNCQTATNLTGVVVPASSLNSSSVLDCSPSTGTWSAMHSSTANFTVFIENVAITQRGSGIVLLVSQLVYTVPSLNGKVESVIAPMTVTAYTAAQVVGDYNADPM